MEYTPENLEYAISVLYKSSDNDRAEANKWLTEAQKSRDAWTFVWCLLDPTKNTEVQFFAATTLHAKLLKHWQEVPEDNQAELCQKIQVVISNFLNGPKIILTRLCISLATFIIHQGAENLIETLRPYSGPAHTSLLLEILKLIPEEFNNMILPSDQHKTTLKSLKDAMPAVLNDIKQRFQLVYDQNTPLSDDLISEWDKAASCAESWLSLDVSGDLDDWLPLAHALHSVVHRIYVNSQEPLNGIHLSTCESCLCCVRALTASPDAVRRPQAAMQLTKMLLQLADAVLSRDNVADSPNEELLVAIFTNATTLGEVQSRRIVEALRTQEESTSENDAAGETARDLVRLLLRCQSAPGDYPVNETRSHISFGFWFILFMDCQERSSEIPDGLKEVYSVLLQILLNKLKPPQVKLDPEQKETLKRYRQEIGDVLIYCNSILGDTCWIVASESPEVPSLQAALALSEVAPLSRLVPAILTLIQRATNATESDSHELRELALRCLAAYACWLGSLPDEQVGSVTDAVLTACLQSLTKRNTGSGIAARCLRRVCSDCPAAAARASSQLILLASTNPTCGVLPAASAAVSHAPSEIREQLLLKMIDIVRPVFVNNQQDVSPKEQKCPCGGCNKVVQLLENANNREVTCFVLRSLKDDFNHFATFHPQEFIPLLKQVVTILLEDCIPFIQDLSDLILVSLKSDCTPEGIDLIKLMCLMFSKDQPPVIGALLSGGVALGLQASSEGAIDVADSLLSVISSLARKRPDILVYIENQLAGVIQLACVCVSCNGCVRSAAAALTGLVGSISLNGLTSISANLSIQLPILLFHFVRAISGALPKNQIEPLGDIILVVKQQGSEAMVREMLTKAFMPLAHIKQTEVFINDIFKGRSTKRKVVDAVRELVHHT